MDLQAAETYIAQYEGRTTWIYRDSAAAGNATIGIGVMLPSADAATRLPIVDSQGRPATADQIRAVYAAVMALPAGRPAGHYLTANGVLHLPTSAVSSLFQQRAQGFLAALQTYYPDFARWPQPAQLATLDWVWNCGISALLGTQHLAPALHAHRWVDAANACHRAGDDGTPDHPTEHGKRNAATKRLYLQAAGGAA